MKNFLSKSKVFLSLICICILAMPQFTNAASPLFSVVVLVDPGYNLNVRLDPSTSSEIVDKLKYGEIVEVYQTSGKWYKISSGWIHKDYTGRLTKTSGYRYATANLKLREAPGTNYPSILTITKGSGATAVYTYGNWTCVYYTESHGIRYRGWVNNSYIE